MLKVSFFEGHQNGVPGVIPLHTAADPIFEKLAAPSLRPEVQRYIDSLQPRDNAQYVLASAMGACEYYSSNSNADAFTEASLIHAPDDWTGSPVLDIDKAKDWPYGFPTFYRAKTFLHHKNRDPARSVGDVELAAWNPHMHRVELVMRLDKDRCSAFDGQGAWDKLKNGHCPDVSMGCVPAGTRVMLHDGSFREMEQMHEADLVLSHKGQAKRVDQLHRYRYKGTIYKFKAYGFRRELCLTANHPLWLIRAAQLVCKPETHSSRTGNYTLVAINHHCTPAVKETSVGCARAGCLTEPKVQFEWVRADEVAVGDHVAFAVPDKIEETISDPIEAKFLGYYLAEGHVGNYNDRPLEQITFSLGYQEKELAEEIEALARALGATVVWHYEIPERGARTVCVVSKTLAERCLCFCGSGAKSKQLSREVVYMAPPLQLSFLGAYLDGDGGTYKGAAYFSTASEQLSQQLFVVLARCGLIASINEINHRPSEKSVVRKDTVEYQVWVGTDFSYLLAGYTIKPVRKSKKVRGQRFFYKYEGVNYVVAPITEIIEEDYDDDVFNISVKGDDSYHGELLATHNTRVPFDLCNICSDLALYKEAWSTYKPGYHKHPGEAILEFHKKLRAQDGVGIRGLSITRKDYCQCQRELANRILPDGRKVWVYNDFPNFFDISIVFIGADKIAKVMMKIADSGKMIFIGSAEMAERLGVVDDDLLQKAASAGAIKNAKQKKSEIIKDVVPNQTAGKAVPLLTKQEPDLPAEALSGHSLDSILSTTAGLGMVLRPREFQRITLICGGNTELAEQLARDNQLFPGSEEAAPVSMDEGLFSPVLARALLGAMPERSALGPLIERRVLLMGGSPEKEVDSPTSHPSPVLRKIGAAYNGYRRQLLDFVAGAQGMIEKAAVVSDGEFYKLANVEVSSLFTPLSFIYLNKAFLDELPTGYSHHKDGTK